jgi:hypothetical protein
MMRRVITLSAIASSQSDVRGCDTFRFLADKYAHCQTRQQMSFAFDHNFQDGYRRCLVTGQTPTLSIAELAIEFWATFNLTAVDFFDDHHFRSRCLAFCKNKAGTLSE